MANGGQIEFGVGFKVDKSGLKDIKDTFTQIQSLTPENMLDFNKYSGTSGKQLQQAKKDLEVLKVTAGQVQTAFENAFNPVTGITNLQQLNTSLKNIGMDNISKAFAKGGDIGNQAFYKITKSALTTNMQLRQTNTLLDRMGETLGNTIKWGISSSIMNRFVGSVQQAYGYVQHLDTSLNDIRIVTGKSADEMDKFAIKANDAAKSLGQSTTAYTEAALIYRQQGLGDEETEARTETTLKAANVTGQTGREVSEQLTAVWNGYKVSAEETELYVDKLAAVAASTASDLEELSTGMSKVASAANNMGVDIDQLNAQLATIISVTRQAPESAGTALKTIYARMEDLKISGEDEDGVKLGEVSSTLDEIGVHIMDAEGNMRDLGEVIEEVGNKWTGWTRAQQDAIAQAIAGKRQYNNLLALFDGWDMYNRSLETSRNAMGTLQQQQDIYMESTAAHVQELKTAWEDFYDSLIDTDDINNVLDVFTSLVNGMTRFLDGIGGGRNALLMFGSTLTNIFSKQISAGLTEVIQGFTRIKTNAAELEAQLNNIQLFKTSEQYNTYEPVQVLVDSMEQVSQYYSILNNDQINYANSLAQQAAEAKELEIQWQQNTEALQAFQQELSNIVSTESAETGTEMYPEIAGKEFNANDIQQIEARRKALEETRDEIQNFGESYQTFRDIIDKQGTDIAQSWNDITEQVEKTQTTFKNFEKLKLFKNVDPSVIDKVKTALQGMNKAANAKHIDSFNVSLEEFQESIADLPPQLQNTVQELLKLNETLNQTDFSAPAQRLQQFLQQAQMQNFINNLTTGFSALGQFASGLTSLSHSFDTLGDSSLSTSEKIIQFISSVGMGMSMLISSAVNLPNFIAGLQQIPQAMHKVNLSFSAWVQNLDAVTAKEKILDGLNDEQINALFTRAGVQKLANDELTQEEALLVIDQAAKEGDIAATEILDVAITDLTAKVWGFITSLSAAQVAMIAIVAVTAAVAVATAAVAKAHANAAKHAAEDAKAQYEASKEKANALNEEYENVQKLIDAYKELKEQYDSSQVDALKQRIYELSQEYDVHIDMIALMKADYEELDGIMNQLLQDISGQKTAADLEVVNAHIEAIISQMKSVEADNNHPLIKLWMTIENLSDVIYNNIVKIIEEISGVEMPPWLENIVKLIGFNPGSYIGSGGAAKGVKQYNEYAVNQMGNEEVRGVISVNSAGFLEFDEEKFAKEYSKEQQEVVLNWLEQNYTENDEIPGLIETALEPNIKGIEQAIRDTAGDREEARKEFSAAEKQAATDAYTQLYGQEGLKNIEDYDTAQKTISVKLKTDLDLSDEEANALAKATIDENSDYNISAGKAVLDELQKTGDYSEQELAEFSKQFNSLSDSQTDFVAKNIDVINGMKHLGMDTNEIFANLKSGLDVMADKDYYINIQTVFNGNKNSKDYKESLEQLFSSNNMGMSQDEFQSLDEADQKSILLLKSQEALTKLDEDEAKQNKVIEQRNKALDEEINRYKKLAEEREKQLDKEKLPDFAKGLGLSKQDLKKNDKTLQQYNEHLRDLELQYKQNAKYIPNYVERMNQAGDAIDAQNKSIDNLQTAYQSLQSITEDYNDDGKISLDNMQALISMPSEYAAALDIENGAMSINDQLMQQQLDSKIALQKAQITAQYLAELEAIANGQLVNTNKQAVESELMKQSAIQGVTAAANEGYQALLKYAKSSTDAFKVDPEAAEQATKAYYNKMQIVDNASLSSTSDLLGKKDTSKSSSSNKPDKQDYLEREVDVFREVNQQLENVESILGRIQKFDEHSWGLSAKKALEQENKLLKNQLSLLEQKKDIAEDDLATRRKALEDQGVNFSSDGSTMTNAEEKLDQLYAEYNAMVDNYNSMSKDEQENYKDTLEEKKDTVKKIEDAMKDYESAFSDYNSILDEILDTHYELIENEVNHFNADIDVHLELDEAEQEWNDFWYEVVQDIDDEDFAGKIAQSVGKLNTLIGKVGETRDSQVAELTDHLNAVTAEVNTQIAAAAQGGGDSLFGDDSALSKENLENYRDQLMDAVRAAKEEIDEMGENYLNVLDKAQDLIDDQIEGWETINDHIEHNLELIKLVSGEKAFDALSKQFSQQYDTNLQLVEAQKMSMDYWQERMNYFERMRDAEQEGSKMYKIYDEAFKKASENYTQAVQDLDKTVEDAIKNLQEWQKNQMDAIYDSLDKAFSKGMGLEDLKSEWDLVIEEQDNYLDNVERAMEMEGLKNEFDDVLKNMDLRGAKQQEFLKWQDEELQKLNDRNKLTQYDIDELKARLEIKKQELALEEAQQNKSNLRLRRDSQGNYTYQYTADEDNVEEAEDGLLTAKREWYELVKKRNEETTNEVIEIRKRILEAEQDMQNALIANDETAYNNAKARYEFLINYSKELMGDAEKTKRDFYAGTAEFFADVDNNQILPMWDTTVQQMIDAWDNGGEDSFIGAATAGISALEQVELEFGNRTDQILNKAGVNYQNLRDNGIDPTTDALRDMQDTNEELNMTLEDTNDLMTQLEGELQNAIAAYNELEGAAVAAIQAANDALNTLAQTAIQTVQEVEAAVASAQSAASLTASSLSNYNSGGGGGGNTKSGLSNNTTPPTDVANIVYTIVQDPNGVPGTYGIHDNNGNYVYISGNKEDVQKKLEELQRNLQRTTSQYNASHQGSKQTYGFSNMSSGTFTLGRKTIKKNGFDTGGYTGEWENGSKEGRLAVLHQKELVLNESDTSNILSAVNAVRDLVKGQSTQNYNGLANSIVGMAKAQASILGQIGTGMLQSIASMVTNTSDVQNYKNMTINADFSGVRSADAIYQAFMELENYGSQQAYSNAPHANSSF